MKIINSNITKERNILSTRLHIKCILYPLLCKNNHNDNNNYKKRRRRNGKKKKKKTIILFARAFDVIWIFRKMEWRKKKQEKITEMIKELFFSVFFLLVVDKKAFIIRKWYQEWLLNIYIIIDTNIIFIEMSFPREKSIILEKPKSMRK